MTGLIVGRFQPFHLGHLAVASALRNSHPQESLLLAIGSAQESYTPDNPFTAGERMEMIQGALTEAQLDGCLPVPVVDIHQHAQWVGHLRGLLPPFEVVYTNNPLTRMLFERDHFRVESPPLVAREQYRGVEVRRRMALGENWQELLPPSVARFLEEIGGAKRVQRIAEPKD